MFSASRRSPQYSTIRNTPLSVVICAKNEARNLEKVVPAIFAQNYPNFQVVVVDDCSTDDTPMVLAQLKEKYPELYTTTIPTDSKFLHGKKLAITVGIKAAKREHMVFTDADCLPASEMWLNEIACSYMNGASLVIGYGRYAKASGLLNFYIRYETFWNAVQYFGFARRFRPFMGVGRNMSYTKTLYNQSTKFRNTYMLASGDDDLFISEKGTCANTNIYYSPLSHTVSEPKRTWHDWIAQKARHLTTSHLYPASVKSILIAETICRQLFYIGAVLLLIFGNEPMLITVASIIAVREVIMYISLGLSQKHMGEKGLWPFAIVMDILVPWIQATAGIASTLTKSRNTWK